MWENLKFKSTNASGSVAAAYLVFSVGLVGCAICTGLWFHQNPDAPLVVLAVGGLLALLTLLLKLRTELPSEGLWAFARGHRSVRSRHVPLLLRSKTRASVPPQSFGTNQPPTVEEIRELKDTARNWVPSRTHGGRDGLRDSGCGTRDA